LGAYAGERRVRRHRRRFRLLATTIGAVVCGGVMLAQPPLQSSLEPIDGLVAVAQPVKKAIGPLVPGEARPEVTRGRDTVSGPDIAAESETAPIETVEARPGDTPLKLLARMGVAPQDAQAAVRELSTVWNPRDLKAGQKAAVFVQDDRLLSFRLALAPDRDIVIARDDRGSFVVEDQDRPTREVATLGTGTIQTSLAASAGRAGVPAGVLGEIIGAFSYDVDFQREVRPGDTFTVLYRRVHDEFGRPTELGRLVYAEMVLSGTGLRLYRFTPRGSEPGYFNAVGENIKKPLLRTPVDGARLTSSFGMRFHPLLGYSRMHRGVDFGAPTGTAIYAAGDGVVVRAGRASGYGNYVEIEHNQQYTTAYGHLSAFARGLHQGERVRQGEVIGYVGMTGMATGPHLHYEVHYQGAQVDPLSIKMPALTRLAGDDLKAFEAGRNAVEHELYDLRQDLVAQYGCRPGCC
jgi:murein DD-endopeptidase MepM/ murein hydrolase activator NlpD